MSVPLAERVAALRDGIEAAEGHLDPSQLHGAPELLAKVGARIALGEATVVALAGPTGSGKSTLFNALAGAEVSPPGVRRPTTGTTHATVWATEADDSAPLLDWLGVTSRHYQPDPDPGLRGLVLLDLPDHDSTAVSHRLQVDRLVELVDVLIWVLDPQKYADASVHDRYLRPYVEHAAVLLVVLNQVDRLDEAALDACRRDLRGLLDDAGLDEVPILPVSSRTGLGLDELRKDLVRRVAAHRAAQERLAADVRSVAAQLAEHCAGGRAGEVSRAQRTALVEALAGAAGVSVVTEAVERAVRARGTAATGWPPLRWISGWRPDPLRRLHLRGPAETRGRTSLPGPTRVQEAAMASALRRVRESAGDQLPDAWRDDLRRSIEAREPQLPDRLDRAVAGAELDAERPSAWWGAVGALQWVLLLVVLAGALWLLGLVALGFLRLDDVVPMPRVEGIPLPTLLLLGGLLAGALVAMLSRPLVAATARRRARNARRRMLERVEQVAATEVLEPISEHLDDYQRFCSAVARARA